MGPLEYGNQDSFCYFRGGILAFKTSLFFLHALSPTVTIPNWQFKALVYQILSSWKRGCFFPLSSHGHSHNHNWIHVQSKVLVCPSPAGKAIHRAVECQDRKRPQRCSSLLYSHLYIIESDLPNVIWLMAELKQGAMPGGCVARWLSTVSLGQTAWVSVVSNTSELCTWGTYLKSSSLSFLICKMGVICIILTS